MPAVIALAPDLVIANEEEDRLADLAELRAAGLDVDVRDIRDLHDLVVLPDEPYAFSPSDGPEACAAWSSCRGAARMR